MLIDFNSYSDFHRLLFTLKLLFLSLYRKDRHLNVDSIKKVSEWFITGGITNYLSVSNVRVNFS
jgi:hypothetical protein